MNPVQFPKISEPISEKKDIQINVNGKPRMAKKNPTIRRKTVKENTNISNNTEQQTKITPIQKTRMSGPKPTLKVMQKPNPSLKNPYRRMDNSWLNKYFIYRHETLNKYLNQDEFRLTIDKLSDNYQKQIFAYCRLKPYNNYQTLQLLLYVE